MAFLKRLGFYLIGFSIGLVFLFFFLKKKSDETGSSFCYFPNCRVLKDIRSKKLINSPLSQRIFEEQILDSLRLEHFFREGEIDFKKSNTEAIPCKEYYIEGEIEEKLAFMRVANCDSTVLIKEFEFLD